MVLCLKARESRSLPGLKNTAAINAGWSSLVARQAHNLKVAGSNPDYFFDKDIIKIENRNLDVVVRFGFNILKGRILYCTKFGIWSYHHGDNNFFKGGPSGFWEMYKKNPITGCVLQRLSEKLDSGDVIYRTYGSTSNYISLIENRFNLYNKCIPFVMRCLRKLYNKRTLEIEKKIKNKEKKNL